MTHQPLLIAAVFDESFFSATTVCAGGAFVDDRPVGVCACVCVFRVCACVYDVNVSLTALSLVQLGGRSVPDPAHRVLLRPGSVGRAHGPPGRV